MNAKTLYAPTIEGIRNQLTAVLASDYSPSLAIVFSSIAHDLHQLSAVFREQGIDILGATTAGEFVNDEIFEKSIVALLLDIHQDCYRVYFGNVNHYSDSYEVGKSLAEYSRQHFKKSAYITVFNTAINGELLVDGIGEVLQGEFSIFGGMAGDDAAMVNTYVFDNDHVADHSLACLILDAEKIQVSGLALSGWKPIGVDNVITKSEGNIIYRINDEPALEVFNQFFGEYHHVNEKDGTVVIATAQYPIQVKRKGNYVLRAVLNADEENQSLLMAGPVREGESFKFSIAPGFEIIEETIDGFREFRDKHQDADALILFSCLARHMSLGPLIEEEIAGISELWKAPLVGFFTYGEIGKNADGSSDFYNETCSLVMLKAVG